VVKAQKSEVCVVEAELVPEHDLVRRRRVREIFLCGYARIGGELGRANRPASLYAGSARLPGIGGVVTKTENAPVLGIVLRGGLVDGRKLPDHYLAELRRVGRRPGYARVARAVFSNVDSMVAARELYRRVATPVTLVYGDRDWSRLPEREANVEVLSGCRINRAEGHGTLRCSGTAHTGRPDPPRKLRRLTTRPQSQVHETNSSSASG
jgi:pimeloyl-ACP methyl ester carboxylesterase